MKRVFFIYFLLLICSCKSKSDDFDPIASDSKIKSRKDICQESILYSIDSSINLSVLSVIDTNVSFDDHLILKNDMVSTQEVFIEKNGLKKRILLPKEDTNLDTTKIIGNKKYNFFSHIVTDIYIDEYPNKQIVLGVKFAGFNNGTGEKYYYYDVNGRYLGSLNCSKDKCDTLGCDFFKKSISPLIEHSKSVLY